MLLTRLVVLLLPPFTSADEKTLDLTKAAKDANAAADVRIDLLVGPNNLGDSEIGLAHHEFITCASFVYCQANIIIYSY